MDYDSPEWKEGQRRLAEMATENAKLRQRLARYELQAERKHPAPCAGSCEANAYKIEIRRLNSSMAAAQAREKSLREILHLFVRYESEMEAGDHVAGMLTYAAFADGVRAAMATPDVTTEPADTHAPAAADPAAP